MSADIATNNNVTSLNGLDLETGKTDDDDLNIEQSSKNIIQGEVVAKGVTDDNDLNIEPSSKNVTQGEGDHEGDKVERIANINMMNPQPDLSILKSYQRENAVKNRLLLDTFKEKVCEVLNQYPNGRCKVSDFRPIFQNNFGYLPLHPMNPKSLLNRFPNDFFYSKKDRTITLVNFRFPDIVVKPSTVDTGGEDSKQSKFKTMFLKFLSLCPEKKILGKRLWEEIKIDGIHSTQELAEVSSLNELYRLMEGAIFKKGIWIKLQFSENFRENRDRIKSKVIEILKNCPERGMIDTELFEKVKSSLGVISTEYEQTGFCGLKPLLLKFADTFCYKLGYVSLKNTISLKDEENSGVSSVTGHHNNKPESLPKDEESNGVPSVTGHDNIKPLSIQKIFNQRRHLELQIFKTLSIHKMIEKDTFWEKISLYFPRMDLTNGCSAYGVSHMDELFDIFKDTIKFDVTNTWVLLNEGLSKDPFIGQLIFLLKKNNGFLLGRKLKTTYYQQYKCELPHSLEICNKMVKMNSDSNIKWKCPNGKILLRENMEVANSKTGVLNANIKTEQKHHKFMRKQQQYRKFSNSLQTDPSNKAASAEPSRKNSVEDTLRNTYTKYKEEKILPEQTSDEQMTKEKRQGNLYEDIHEQRLGETSFGGQISQSRFRRNYGTFYQGKRPYQQESKRKDERHQGGKQTMFNKNRAFKQKSVYREDHFRKHKSFTKGKQWHNQDSKHFPSPAERSRGPYVQDNERKLYDDKTHRYVDSHNYDNYNNDMRRQFFWREENPYDQQY